MAKKHRIYPHGTRFIREAVPSPREVAAFIAPRTMEDGLSLANILGDMGEMTPFAGAVPYAERELGLRDYSDEDIMLAAILGFPILGKFKNLKEAVGDRAWAHIKSRWKYNKPDARKLYADPNARRTYYTGGNTEGGLSTRTRSNATADARDAIEVPAGPYNATNIGSDIVNSGQTVVGNNTVPTNDNRRARSKLTGEKAWQGDMYPPGRRLANTEEGLAYALEKLDPSQHEYIRKLNDIINENENKWEFLINKTRPSGNERRVIPKEDIADIAMAQGRPDIAARVMADNKPRASTNPTNPNYNKRFVTYGQTQLGELKDNAKWKDVGNRQVEKELREQYSMLPDDMEVRQKFAEIYGVPDLYKSWMDDPLIWAKYKNDTKRNRYNRETSNRSKRRQRGWENPNQ